MNQFKAAIPTKATTDFGKRWLEMMAANGRQELSDDELRMIALDVAAHQRDVKIIRRDRFVPNVDATRKYLTKKGVQNKSEFIARERALMQNQSDAAILDEVEEVESEMGLDMSPKEQVWYDYVLGGGDVPFISNRYE